MEIIGDPASGSDSLPIAPAIVAGDFVFVSGQVAFDDNGSVVGDDIRTQTAQTIHRIERLLRAAGSSLQDVVSTSAFLVDATDFAGFNEAWQVAFGSHRPTRTTVRTDLLLDGLLVEISAIARRGVQK